MSHTAERRLTLYTAQDDLQLLRKVWQPWGVESGVVDSVYHESRDDIHKAHRHLCELFGQDISLAVEEDGH